MTRLEIRPDDCRRCGACCYSESPRHVRVMGDDYARLGDFAEGLVHWIGNAAFMRLVPGAEERSEGPRACAALVVDPETRTFSCSIYEQRPQVCRDLERGSSACFGELVAKAGRPKRALALASQARAGF